MPDALLDADVLRAAVQLACRAPSLHNSQPWQWVAEGADCTYTSITAGFSTPPTSRGGRPSSAAAPCSTIYASRWPQPGGRPTLTDFPTRTTSIISRHLISAQ